MLEEWDFSGITIKIDIKRSGEDPLGTATVNIASDGAIDGNLTANGSYTCNNFTVTLNGGSLDFVSSLTDIVQSAEITGGELDASVSDIENVDGALAIKISCDSTTWQFEMGLAEDSTAKAFGMDFTELSLTVSVENDWTIQEFSGTISVKHGEINKDSGESLDTNVSFEGVSFVVVNGELTQFSISSAQAEVKCLDFVVENGSFTNGSGVAKLTIDSAAITISDYLDLTVTGFEISSDGEISFESASGNLNKAPLTATFTAGYENNKFSGNFEFNGPSPIIVSGALELGTSAKSSGSGNFTYVYVAVTLPTPIPLGPTGLKLTSVSGEFGYNWYVDDTYSGKGGPVEDNIRIGIGIGLSDVGDLMALEGKVGANLGANPTISITGQVDVTASNPYFSGTLTVDYNFGTKTITATLTSTLKIPQSGSVLNLDQATAQYTAGDSGYAFNIPEDTGKITGTLFSVVDLTASASLTGQLANPISTMSGAASLTLQSEHSYSASWPDDFDRNDCDDYWDFGFAGTVDISLTGTASITISSGDFTGSVSAEASGSLDAYYKWPTRDCTDAILSANGNITLTKNASGECIANGSLTVYNNGETDTYEIEDVKF